MKPAPIPWILWAPGAPPEMTGLSVGSTATICKRHKKLCELGSVKTLEDETVNCVFRRNPLQGQRQA